MADIRSSFPGLEDASTGAGLALHKVAQGDAAAGKNAAAVLMAKDASGNLQYPLVNAQRELVVSTQGGSLANLSEAGNVAGHASIYQAIATIVLQAGFSYKNLAYVVGSYRDSRYKIVLNDNGTPVILVNGMFTTAGDPSDSVSLPNFAFDAGATGTQQLILYGLNQNTVSDVSGTIEIDEVQP